MEKNSKNVFVAMSGGVDSSVAALLFKKPGCNVTGVFMRCYNVDGCQERDAEDARRVASQLEIPFYVWDFEEEYKKRVVSYMIDGYRRGITPNPDVMCNREIKFGLFLERALAAGADYIATGHYVRLVDKKLYEAADKNKDQSYFLWTLKQEQLKHCFFPIGDYLKSEVRAMAREAGLATAEKKDSQGICFLGKVTLNDFLKTYIAARKGAVLTTKGEKVGEHDGAYFYTIGQRHGLDLKNKNRELGVGGEVETKPHYVAEKNIERNTVVVAEGSDNPALYKKEIIVDSLNWIGDVPNGFPLQVFVRIRYRQPLAAATLTENQLVFDYPQKFVAPGQSAVFYSRENGGLHIGRQMLGGGLIVGCS